MKVAIVHDWLVVHGGAEKVLDEMLALFPEADLHALLCHMPGEPPRRYRGRPVRTSYIQQLPGGVSRYRHWLPLFPHAIRSLDLSAYDLVVSLSSCVAKGVRVGPHQRHVSYCFTPVRYAWDLREQYLDTAGFRGVARWGATHLLERLRRWDAHSNDGVHRFVTLSHHIANRIQRCYGRESTVVYPPVDLGRFTPADVPRHGFVTASRLVPYKLVPMIVRAFAAMPDCPLTVIGDGPDLAACQRAAAGHPHIRVLGYQSDELLRAELQRAEAFVFAALEDFGIAPVEAQACGTPVIAFGVGGATETVVNGHTGRLFARQDEAAVREAVAAFRAAPPPTPAACRGNAERFSSAAFRAGMLAAVEQTLAGAP
ncbi:MAG: glycosyltransferase [Gemmatimonadetes bacterium]|nr:glycosyltransferase [Gemmatimonadota bacterium]